MAAGDSLNKDLNDRTKELVDKRVEKGQGLQVSQEALNQLQSLQDAQRSNLNQARADLQSRQQRNDILNQAGQVLAETTQSGNGPQINPQTQAILGKYGVGQPKFSQTQSRDVKIQPGNVIINNNYNTTQTNNVGGPVQGRGISMKSPQASSSSGSIAKFKSWLSSTLQQQQEQDKKRTLLYDRQEQQLSRSGNDMLKKVESAGKDIIANMSPQVIGTTLRSQLQVLLFMFAGTFLAKHFDGFMKIFKKIHDGFKKGLAWFGIGDDGKKLKAAGKGIQADIITFFGGNPKRDTMGTVLKGLMDEAANYFHKKLKYMMEERATAIKSIQFPKLDFSDISNTLTGIGNYLSDILAALMDPESGLKSSLSHGINSTGLAESLNWDPSKYLGREDSFGNNTSYGDMMLFGTKNGNKSYVLDRAAMNGDQLKGNAYSTASQSMDLVGALNDARSTGKINTARIAAGFERLNKVASSKGYVEVTKDFLLRYYGPGRIASGIRSGQIVPVVYKFIRVPKTEAELDAQNAGGFWSGYMKSSATGAAMDSLGVSGLARGMVKGKITGTNGYGITTPLAGAAAGAAIGSVIPGVGTVIGAGVGAMIGNSDTARDIASGVHSWVRSKTADKYTLVMVPLQDRRPGVRNSSGKLYQVTLYRVKRSFLLQIEKLAFGSGVDTGNEHSLNNIRNYIVKRNGGYYNMRSTWNKGSHEKGDQQEDVNIGEYTQGMTDLKNKEKFDQDDLAGSLQQWGQVGNNAIGAINTGIDYLNSGIDRVNNFINPNATQPITGEQRKANAKYIMDYFIKKGFTKEQAAGIVGNMVQESGLNPTQNQVGGGGGYGLIQWTDPSRKAALYKFAGTNNPSLQQQLDFTWREMITTHKGAINAIARSRTAAEAAQAFESTMEAAGKPQMQNRVAFANGVLQGYTSGSWDSLAANVKKYGTSYASSSKPGKGGSYVGNSSNPANLLNGTGTVQDPGQQNPDNGGSGIGINLKIPHIPHLPQKTQAELAKEQKANKLKNSAAQLWKSKWVQDTYKKNGSGYIQFEAWYLGASPKERATYFKNAKAWDEAKRIYDGEGPSWREAIQEMFPGTKDKPYSGLAQVLMGAPWQKWREIRKEIDANGYYIRYGKRTNKTKDNIKSVDDLFQVNHDSIQKFYGTSGQVQSSSIRNFLDGGDIDKKTAETNWYNAVNSQNFEEADRILKQVRSQRAQNGYYNGKDRKTFEQEENFKIGLVKSQVAFSDIFAGLKKQLVNLSKQYDSLSDVEQAGGKGNMLNYQREMIVNQMSSLSKNAVNINPNWSTSTKRRVMLANNKNAQFNSQEAALDYELSHLAEKYSAMYESGELDKYMKPGELYSEAAIRLMAEDKKRILAKKKQISEARKGNNISYAKALKMESAEIKQIDDWANKGSKLDDGDLLKMTIEDVNKKYGTSGVNAYIDAWNRRSVNNHLRLVTLEQKEASGTLSADEYRELATIRSNPDALDKWKGLSSKQISNNTFTKFRKIKTKNGEMVARNKGEHQDNWAKRVETLFKSGKIDKETLAKTIAEAEVEAKIEAQRRWSRNGKNAEVHIVKNDLYLHNRKVADKGAFYVVDGDGRKIFYNKFGKHLFNVTSGQARQAALNKIYGQAAALENKSVEQVRKETEQAKKENNLWRQRIKELGYRNGQIDEALAEAAMTLAYGEVNVKINGTLKDEKDPDDKESTETPDRKNNTTSDSSTMETARKQAKSNSKKPKTYHELVEEYRKAYRK